MNPELSADLNPDLRAARFGKPIQGVRPLTSYRLAGPTKARNRIALAFSATP
jgi:hypothetical protein